MIRKQKQNSPRRTDDKAYLRPGTADGFEKARNTRILTLSDVEKARALRKYHWPERLVHITLAAHRISINKGETEGDKEARMTEDHHIVYVKPKATLKSLG